MRPSGPRASRPLRRTGSLAALRRVSLAALAALACVCIVIFAVHRSADPRLFGWSERYLFGAMLPLLGVIAAQAVLVVWPPLEPRAERLVGLACAVGGVLVLILGVQVLPLYELPPMALFLGLMALALAGYRAFRREGWLISYVALSALCLLLFVPEALRLGHE